MESGAFSLSVDGEAEPPWRVGSLHIHDAPLTEWGSIVGDAVHNLRCALDHVVYYLARRNGYDPAMSRTAFPVVRNRRDYFKLRRQQSGPRQSFRDIALFGLTDVQKEVVDAWQPFQPLPDDLTAGERQVPHPLLVISELDNVDKHREINVAYGGLSEWPRVDVKPRDPGRTHRVHRGSGA